MDSHLALLPAMEPEVLEQLLAQQRSQGDAGAPQGMPRVLASTVGNAILMDLHKLGIRRVGCLSCICCGAFHVGCFVWWLVMPQTSWCCLCRACLAPLLCLRAAALEMLGQIALKLGGCDCARAGR